MDTHTYIHTHRTTTVTLATHAGPHALRGLITIVIVHTTPPILRSHCGTVLAFRSGPFPGNGSLPRSHCIVPQAIIGKKLRAGFAHVAPCNDFITLHAHTPAVNL